MKKKILFIVNPKAGTGFSKSIKSFIESYVDKTFFDFSITETMHAGQATVIAANAVDESYDCVVAVGGDGTVNEIAKSLCNTKTAFGIIPIGSGNGLARHLEIPTDCRKAITLINNFKTKSIDTFEVNEKFAINVAGAGFDAFVAKRFAESTSRGFFNYVRCVMQSYFAFNSFATKILIDGNYIETTAWMISFANSTQFGNNASIAPYAIINDGVLDVTVCKKIPLVSIPFFALRLFTKRLKPSALIQFHKVTRTVVTFQKNIPLHIDGEPKGECDKIEIRIKPLSLKVVC